MRAFSAEWTIGGGANPGFHPGLAAYVEFGQQTSGFLVPSFRVGGAIQSFPWTRDEIVTTPGDISVDGTSYGTATFKSMVARLDACPMQWVSSQPWASDALAMQLCARFDAGRLDVQGNDWGQASARRFWAAAGSVLRLRWTFPHVFIEVNGGASFPITRERFFVNVPNQVLQVFDVPAVAATMGSGFGVFFL